MTDFEVATQKYNQAHAVLGTLQNAAAPQVLAKADAQPAMDLFADALDAAMRACQNQASAAPYQLAAAILANMAVWAQSLGEARGYAQDALDNIAIALEGVAQDGAGAQQLLFWQQRMQGIVARPGQDTDPAPMWGTATQAYLDAPKTQAASSGLWLGILAALGGGYAWYRRRKP